VCASPEVARYEDEDDQRDASRFVFPERTDDSALPSSRDDLPRSLVDTNCGRRIPVSLECSESHRQPHARPS
jgi:hypothetical protein